MNEFRTYHPAVNFLYFATVILFSMILMNPVTLAVSLVCAVTYSIMLGGRKAVRFNLLCLFPMLLAAVIINAAFNHRGMTILLYLPSGNPLTLEAIVYGIAAAVMIAAVICCFSCFNKIITSDKFIYLFGRIIPTLSLILSMSLRFVPKFREQLAKTVSAQRSKGRFRDGIAVLSIMMTRAFEDSIETADSMKNRGYGLKGRSAFSIYIFSGRDIIMLVYTLALTVYVIIGIILGALEFMYFPKITEIHFNAYSISVYTAYLLLCAEPIIIEIAEVIRWKHLKSKI